MAERQGIRMSYVSKERTWPGILASRKVLMFVREHLLQMAGWARPNGVHLVHLG